MNLIWAAVNSPPVRSTDANNSSPAVVFTIIGVVVLLLIVFAVVRLRNRK